MHTCIDGGKWLGGWMHGWMDGYVAMNTIDMYFKENDLNEGIDG